MLSADCAAGPLTRRSIIGFYVLLGMSLISWKSKKQHIISRSYVKTEYCAIVNAFVEVMFIQYLLHELKIPSNDLTTLFYDNISLCIA